MATELTSIKLKFSCPVNWDEMQRLDDRRFCSHCQKKVYDKKTGRTRLSSRGTGVMPSQVKNISIATGLLRSSQRQKQDIIFKI